MIDLENELRSRLREKAEAAVTSADGRLPASVRTRIRRRQAGLLLAVGAAISLMIVGLLSLRTLGAPRSLTPGGGAQVAPYPTQLPDGTPAFVIARGGSGSEGWALVAYQSDRSICLELESGTAEHGACGLGESRFEPTNAQLGQGVVVFGGVSPEVSDVVARNHADQFEHAALIPLPAAFDTSIRAFVIGVDEAGGEVAAMDRDGRLVGTYPIPPAPSFAPGDFVGVLDRYGNVIGYVPFDTTPPPPGSTGNEGVWSPPGMDVDLGTIRGVAQADLTKVIPEVDRWWLTRPRPEDPDQAFRDWWSAYPVHEALPSQEAGTSPGTFAEVDGRRFSPLHVGEILGKLRQTDGACTGTVATGWDGTGREFDATLGTSDECIVFVADISPSSPTG
jgi:hypothetical protein